MEVALVIGAFAVVIIILLFLKLESGKSGNVAKPIVSKKNRRLVKDVKPGDIIKIEWYKAVGRIVPLKCLNNDPETKKILLEIRWNNYKEFKCEEREVDTGLQ